MILSIWLWAVIIGSIIVLSHGRAYGRRRSAGMSVWASVRVPGLRWLGARVGVSKRL